MMEMERVLRLLPTKIRRALESENPETVDELRLRAGQAPSVVRALREYPLLWYPKDASVSRQELEDIVLAASGCSVYSVQNQLAAGFLPLPGGHRLGICGTVTGEQGRILSIRDVSSVCIRFARMMETDTSALSPYAEKDLLVIGPPGSGKTTLLRCLIRMISESGRRVAVADERGEIASAYEAAAQFPLGPCTDVMTGGAKGQTMLLLLRAMTPAVMAVDEITAPEDLLAIRQVSYCGVRLLATAHAQGVEELYARPLYRDLLELGIFHTVIVLQPDRSFTVEEVTGC